MVKASNLKCDSSNWIIPRALDSASRHHEMPKQFWVSLHHLYNNCIWVVFSCLSRSLRYFLMQEVSQPFSSNEGALLSCKAALVKDVIGQRFGVIGVNSMLVQVTWKTRKIMYLISGPKWLRLNSHSDSRFIGTLTDPGDCVKGWSFVKMGGIRSNVELV